MLAPTQIPKQLGRRHLSSKCLVEKSPSNFTSLNMPTRHLAVFLFRYSRFTYASPSKPYFLSSSTSRGSDAGHWRIVLIGITPLATLACSIAGVTTNHSCSICHHDRRSLHVVRLRAFSTWVGSRSTVTKTTTERDVTHEHFTSATDSRRWTLPLTLRRRSVRRCQAQYG